MKEYEKDGWFVTTPVLVGSDDEVKKALSCQHPSWMSGAPNFSGNEEFVFERCSDCVAARSRRRPKAGNLAH